MRSTMPKDNRNRWALIPFLSQETLAQLHGKEDKAAGTNWLTVLSGHYRNQMLHQQKLNPFWIGVLTEDQKKSRLDDFVSHLYPIWAPELIAWESTFDKPGTESELSVQHRIELKIWQHGASVDRNAPGIKSRDDKRSAMQAVYESAIED